MAYYAVRKGRKTGIFESWAECREQIFRFSGAVYKSFMTLEEAKAYIEKGSVKKTVTGKVAYVDGSYDETLGYSYGAVLFDVDKPEEQIHLSGRGYDSEWMESRNVAGELLGSISAIAYAYESGTKSLTVFHDYQGVGSWADDEWQATKDITMTYKRIIEEYRRKGMELSFVKVSGHSGNYFNDYADALAKNAVAIIVTDKRFSDMHPVEYDVRGMIREMKGKVKGES